MSEELVPAESAASEAGLPEEDQVEKARGDLIPAWLAALVLLLLIAVAVVGGFLIRAMFVEPIAESSEELAIREFQEAVEVNPSDLQARLSLGYAYQEAGRYDEALAEYDLVLDIDPTDTAALYNKGVVYLETMRLQRAEETLWDVLELEPTHALAAKRLGDYYASLGEYRSLVRAVRPAVEARPEMADLQYLMGLAYENLGHPDWAEARYTLALQYTPDMVEAREGLARLGAEEKE